jgi:hypothetical protein
MDKIALSEEIQTKINILKLNQINRVVNIDNALVKYEENIKIDSVRDYVLLSNHQRTILGHDDKSKQPKEITNNYNTIIASNSEGVQQLMEFLELNGGGREEPSDEVAGSERPVFPDAISAGTSRC